MFLTPKIERAIVRATLLHEHQRRKVNRVPYIVHPYAVAFLLAHYVDDEDVIIAGLLHDVLEDVPHYAEENLREEFGERAFRIVKEVTEDMTQAEKKNHDQRSARWLERKKKYLLNLSDDSEEALLVVAADKIHNLRSFLEDYTRHGEVIWSQLNTKKEGMLWFYGEVVKIITRRLHHPLADELKKTFIEAKNRVSGEDIFSQ
ncbi:MAG: bifunctional (p)ppGpp synthetase/guanosine-3',5'-bis(diphosphate) 3'-pyrophosphohydrolase [Candidatus Moranbacteria bacterium]|nr:bifunctional (p)ppGpp synthetase/guanosine-3',5'-bis(diphosphate) 3'-pyrophosphohydrolase [Candidatus Moranbacteria bacterium]